MRFQAFGLSLLLLGGFPGRANELTLGLGGGIGPLRRPPRQGFGSVELHWHHGGSGLGLWTAWDGAAKEGWAGLGLSYGMTLAGPWLLQGSFGPGWYYTTQKGVDLGSPLEFRSTLTLGRRFRNGWYGGLTFSHLSNGGTAFHNPGAETFRLLVGIPLAR